MQRFGHSHDLFEGEGGGRVEEDREVFDTTELHQLGLRADEVRPQEVQEKLRFIAPQEKVVHQFKPIILVQCLGEEVLQEGPPVLLRMER